LRKPSATNSNTPLLDYQSHIKLSTLQVQFWRCTGDNNTHHQFEYRRAHDIMIHDVVALVYDSVRIDGTFSRIRQMCLSMGYKFVIDFFYFFFHRFPDRVSPLGRDDEIDIYILLAP
jgi:hypothetical protein